MSVVTNGFPVPPTRMTTRPCLQVADRPPADVRLAHAVHRHGRHDPGFDVQGFQGVLQGEAVEDGGQHAHRVGRGRFDRLQPGRELGPAEDVPAADDHGQLDAGLHDPLELAGDVEGFFRLMPALPPSPNASPLSLSRTRRYPVGVSEGPSGGRLLSVMTASGPGERLGGNYRRRRAATIAAAGTVRSLTPGPAFPRGQAAKNSRAPRVRRRPGVDERDAGVWERVVGREVPGRVDGHLPVGPVGEQFVEALRVSRLSDRSTARRRRINGEWRGRSPVVGDAVLADGQAAEAGQPGREPDRRQAGVAEVVAEGRGRSRRPWPGRTPRAAAPSGPMPWPQVDPAPSNDHPAEQADRANAATPSSPRRLV